MFTASRSGHPSHVQSESVNLPSSTRLLLRIHAMASGFRASSGLPLRSRSRFQRLRIRLQLHPCMTSVLLHVYQISDPSRLSRELGSPIYNADFGWTRSLPVPSFVFCQPHLCRISRRTRPKVMEPFLAAGPFLHLVLLKDHGIGYTRSFSRTTAWLNIRHAACSKPHCVCHPASGNNQGRRVRTPTSSGSAFHIPQR
eukprot:3812076-Amphidinium_carterae.1